MDSDVDQTIQWARESLRRRRIELHKKQQDLISDQRSETLPEATNAFDVNSVLRRGRSLLAEAEAHSEIIGQYMPRAVNKEEGQNDGDFMVRFLQAANDSDDQRENAKRFSNIPVERPSWRSQFQQDVADDLPDEKSTHIDMLLQEGEARIRLDNLIATIRRQGDNPLKEMENSVRQVIYDFNPNEMRAAKRADLRKLKLDEEVAIAEEKARKLSSFKALPLPGGAEVKHDLFAPTVSFQSKHVGIELLAPKQVRFGELSSSRSLGGFECFDRTSIATSRSSIDNSFNFAGNEEDKERALQLRLAKRAKKRHLLDSVNKTIAADGEYLDDDVSVAYSVHSQSHIDYVEDPSKLRQQIARLEAKLKRKKSQRSATLNDIVDIDLNTMFERLLSKDADQNARAIVDRLKHQTCGRVVDGVLINDFQPQLVTKENRYWDEQSTASVGVLYRRQNDWVKRREQKLLEARLRVEADEMNDITGKPEVAFAKDSWIKAKSAHDEALKKLAEDEARRQREKAEKERMENEAKLKEIEALQKQANSKLKAIRGDVNKEEQMKRLSQLSQPRQIRDGPTLLKEQDASSQIVDSPKPAVNSQSKDNRKPAKQPSDTPYDPSNAYDDSNKKALPSAPPKSEFVEFSGKRFSDMDDKEFAKVVRRISNLAAKKVRDSNIVSQSSEETCTSPQVTIVGNPDNYKETAGECCGSTAQAKFMQELAKSKIGRT